MTVLAAAQDAGIPLMGRRPLSVFSPNDQFGLELGLLATQSAQAIAEYYDWEQLKKLATIDGDGVTIAFDRPSDYNRMLKKGGIHSKMWRVRTFRQARDEDEFLLLKQMNLAGTPGVWIMLGGQMNFWPAPPLSETASFYYITNLIVANADGLPGSKTRFTSDGDAFVLSERLLTLALIWRWRAQKRLEYAEDLTNYEIALSEEVAKNGGQKVLTVGPQRLAVDAVPAYPGGLGP